MKNKLKEKLTWPSLAILSGIVTGWVDVLTTGLPLFTAYVIYDTGTKIMGDRDSFRFEYRKEILKNSPFYLISNLTLFYIKYSDEVNDFVGDILK